MPPAKAPPRVYQILVRSHRLTIFLTLAPTRTIASIKDEVLSALTSEGNQTEDEVPQVTGVDEFEICRAVKTKGAAPTGYEVLDAKQLIRDCVANWDIVFLQFRDSSTGDLLPVTATQPSIDDEEEAMSVAELPEQASNTKSNTKKRKATSDVEDV